MKHIVDMATWERRDNFNFFRDYVSSWYAVATEFDCTRAYDESKAAGTSFFLRYLHAVLCAANEVEAMRYRIDKDGCVVWHDTVDIITPIAVEGHGFVTVRIPYIADFDRFLVEARRIIDRIDPADNPYGVEEALVESGCYDIVHLSAVPRIYFTSITYTIARPGEACTHPLSTMGKAVVRGDRRIMPYSVYVNHAFVDGSHLADFFDRIQARL